MPLTEFLDQIQAGERLRFDAARWAMKCLVADETPDEQIVLFLTHLSKRVCSGDELAGFAAELRARASLVDLGVESGLVDTCGTGGGYPTFNISTASAIVAAGAGAKIAKHGNRAVTSVCGSADVLEAAGVKIHNDESHLRECMERCGVAFLFAPDHHGVLKRVGPIRKRIGFRTVFNQLGPLLNPASAKRQVLGVFDRAMVQPMAEALLRLGSEHAVVACGSDGLDEISAGAPTIISRVENGDVIHGEWKPLRDFGLEPLDMLRVGPGLDANASATLLETAITNYISPYALAVLPNAAAALWVAGIGDSLTDGVQKAQESIKSGAARNVLEELRKA